MAWKWYGKPMHFIGGNECRFHLATDLGNGYVVSTVGEYQPKNDGVVQTIGYERKYETMVFASKGECKCGCGQPGIKPSELAFEGYNDAKAATRGHMALCKEWAKKRGRKK